MSNIRNDSDSNHMNDLFQTPKTNYKFERNFFFSPGDNLENLIQSKTINQGKSLLITYTSFNPFQ
jgi:hypothetical protein